jgi:hypothetical protein
MRLNPPDRAGSAVRRLDAVLTPARGIAGVLVVAIGVLAASQFLDYREVRAGVPAYSGLEGIAPAPRIDGTEATTGSAHAYLGLALAAVALILVVAAMLERWRLARLLLPVGLAVVAMTLLLDAPKGLDEGAVALRFEGAEARLLGPFWAQLFAGVVIAVCGPLLALNLGPRRAPPSRARSRALQRLPRAPRRSGAGGPAAADSGGVAP